MTDTGSIQILTQGPRRRPHQRIEFFIKRLPDNDMHYVIACAGDRPFTFHPNRIHVQGPVHRFEQATFVVQTLIDRLRPEGFEHASQSPIWTLAAAREFRAIRTQRQQHQGDYTFRPLLPAPFPPRPDPLGE